MARQRMSAMGGNWICAGDRTALIVSQGGAHLTRSVGSLYYLGNTVE